MIRHNVGVGKMVEGSRAVKGIDDGWNKGPCLIACPTHVVPDWREHLEAEYPEDTIIVAAELDPESKRGALSTPADWYIVNHAMLATPAKAVTSRRNYYKMPKVRSFIIDESHNPGLGRKARAWHGARQLADQIRDGLVIPMTATPIRKTADGLWAQFRLMDKTLTSYWRFVHEHCVVVETPWAVEVKGAKPSMARELSNRSIYRRYSDPEVGISLPDVLPKDSKVKITPQTRVAYDRLKKELRDEMNQPVFSAGAAVAKLRIMVAKDPEMVERIETLTEDLDSFVIFVYFHETAHLLARLLDAECITGEIAGQERNRRAKLARRIVATIPSLSSSVDLSDHRHVFMYEECYEPGTQENALGRVARWRKNASDEPVHLTYVYGVNTISERVHNVCSGRAIDAENVTDRRLIREELTA